MEFMIKLTSIEDVVRFVNELDYYECLADAKIDNKAIDARSLMGILNFGMGKVLRVKIYRGFDESLHNFMGQYAVA